ncbi:MAG: ferritin-like domain-containing protein [Actinomycetota bacterium]|nr:ferritin-like domain-containing protein [Actinomycetota bacterium]
MDHAPLKEPRETPPRGALEDLARDPSSRKRFLSMAGGAGAASAFAVFLAACGKETEEGPARPPPQTSGLDQFGKGDVAILNYALTLEYVEADFYEQVVESGVVRDREIASLAKEIGENEQEHVEALRETVSQMGATPAKKPRTKFDTVIAEGPRKILETAAMVENLGAAAYLGQAANIQDESVLAAALSIHTVEARHAAALNRAAGHAFMGDSELVGTLPNGAFAKPMDAQAVLKEVKPFLAA